MPLPDRMIAMADHPRQFTLELPHLTSLSRASYFVSDCNRAAFDTVLATDHRRLAISGPKGAGKTHLAAIWAAERKGIVTAAGDLNDDTVAKLSCAPAVAIEQADAMAVLSPDHRARSETAFFHLMNIAAERDIQLLVTGRTAPARWSFEIPDLASRIAALLHVAIEAPDDALLSSILAKLFLDRQLAVEPGVISYLVVRMERSFAAAERVVSHLDQIALAAKRRITTALASKIYTERPDIIVGPGD